MLYAIEKELARPTLDIDFLGLRINNDLESIKTAFREICNFSDLEDGVTFDLDSIFAEEINETKDYVGVRLSVTAHLDSVKQPLKIDVGFGDILVADPQSLSYPSLIEGLEVAQVLAYSLETVVSEKFQAMVELSVLNSRYKDFYDVYGLLTKHKLDDDLLSLSIIATFQNRKTQYLEGHPLFTDEFANDNVRNQQWQQYLKKKIKKDGTLTFSTVMAQIKERLLPFYEKLQ